MVLSGHESFIRVLRRFDGKNNQTGTSTHVSYKIQILKERAEISPSEAREVYVLGPVLSTPWQNFISTIASS